MKLLTTFLALIIVLLLLNIFELKKRQRYRSNLSREEMSDLLMKVTGDDIAVFIPADTTVWPYLVKDKN
jgi:hypothetical protein